MRAQLAEAVVTHQRVMETFDVKSLTPPEQAATWSVILSDQERLLQLVLRIGDRFPDDLTEGTVRAALRNTMERARKLQKDLARGRIALVPRTASSRKKSAAPKRKRP